MSAVTSNAAPVVYQDNIWLDENYLASFDGALLSALIPNDDPDQIAIYLTARGQNETVATANKTIEVPTIHMTKI